MTYILLSSHIFPARPPNDQAGEIMVASKISRRHRQESQESQESQEGQESQEC